jgi:glycosyltransferase involved in cell wall biosynthesis
VNDSSRGLHVALLIGRFPPGALGGAEHQAECWALRLADRHRVTVVTRADAANPAGTRARDGFTVTRLPVSRVPLWRAWADVRAIGRTLATLEPRPDVLLCFQTIVSGLAGVRAGRRLGIPALVWIRGEGEYRMAGSFANRVIGPRVWGAAAAVLVQSEGNARALLGELARHAAGARPRVAARLHIVPNGLDLPAAGTSSAAGPRILTVGRLIPDKGMDVVIDAVAVAGAALTIAGAGPERERLEARARSAGADVRFEGFVDRARLGALYREAAAVVLAARHGEGQPNALLEAMAAARPIVASRVTGVTDLIEHDVNGLLVPPGDARALGAALDRLSRESGLADRLGSAARRSAERFDWAVVRPRLESLMLSCAAGGRAAAGGS